MQLIGLVLLIVGLIAQFGENVFKSYYESVITDLETSLSSAGYGNVNLDFSIKDFAGSLPLALIISGLVLLIITLCGVVGAFKKVKCLLLIYAMISFILLAAQVLTMGMFYWKPEVVSKRFYQLFHTDIIHILKIFYPFIQPNL